jgi:Uma2 family endonuclease
MAEQAPRLMTVTEFLKWDDGTQTHYELLDGRVYAMASPSSAHARIAGTLGRMIGNVLKPPCYVSHQAAVTIPDDDRTCYEADILVSCAPHTPGQQVSPEPILIVEIQSPSTGRYDESVKSQDYMRLPSVQEILLISSERRQATLHRREGDGFHTRTWIGTATFELQSVGCRIDLTEVYAGLEL